MIAIFLLLALGAAIVIMDRRQLLELLDTSEWRYLIGAFALTGLSYAAGSLSFLSTMRIFGVKEPAVRLFNIGLSSMVMLNLIGQPAGLSLRVLLMGEFGTGNSQTIAASLLLSYLKNLFYFALIPFSLLYIAVSHQLPASGTMTVLIIMAVFIILLGVASGIMLSTRLRDALLRISGRLWKRITRRDISMPLGRFSEQLTMGVDSLKEKRSYRLPLAVSIVVDVLATVGALWFCFAALGIPVHLGVLLTGFNFGITLTVISFIPGDLGIQEASMAGYTPFLECPSPWACWQPYFSGWSITSSRL